MEENVKRRMTERLETRHAALIVVDVQNDFCHPDGAFAKKGFDLSHVERAVMNLLPFIDQCRRFGLPVIFVRTFHSDWTDSSSWMWRLGGMNKETPVCRLNSWGAEFYKVKPQESDFIVTKHRFSGFVGTDLDLVLRSRGMETLLFTGVATNVCVETTTRDGFNLNYNVILVEDCCGPFTPEEHASTVTNITNYFGTVCDSKALFEIMGRLKK
jgi:ureidoacrylate peracid hydrolase